jgi:DNA-binding NarL/FixJ family response regulator
MIPSFFLPWDSWLRSRPEFADWEKGCSMIAQRVRDLTQLHCADVCGEPVTTWRPLHFAVALRIWTALAFHWEQKPCSLAEQLANLADCQGSKGNLGSDPLRDAALCEAVLHHHPNALELFVKEHRGTILKRVNEEARLQNQESPIGREVSSEEDCLLRFVSYMAGFERSWQTAESVDFEPRYDENINGSVDSADDIPDLSSTSDVGENSLQPAVPDFEDWCLFVARHILQVEPSAELLSRKDIKTWIESQAIPVRSTIDVWWQTDGVRANAQQIKGVPLAKYRGKSGLAGGYVTSCARFFAKGLLKGRRNDVPLVEEIPAGVEKPLSQPISPECLAQVRRWLQGALEAWHVFSSREEDEAQAFIRENFDDLPLRTVGLVDAKQLTAGEWQKVQEKCQRLHFAFLLKLEQGWSNREIAAALQLSEGQTSRILQVAGLLLQQMMQGLKVTKRIELSSCVKAEGLEDFRSALFDAWRQLDFAGDLQ